MNLKDQITNIFIQIDDFCKEFDAQIKKMKFEALGDSKKRRNRATIISDSEIITIMIGFHLGAHKTFKNYYKEIVCGYWKDLFPKSLSYNSIDGEKRRFCFPIWLNQHEAGCELWGEFQYRWRRKIHQVLQ